MSHQEHQKRGNNHEEARYPVPPRNSYFFKHDTDALCVIVTANWIGRLSTWSLNVKVNGELVDAFLSDDVWKDAKESIQEAIFNSDPVPVTATVTEAERPPAVEAA